MPTTLPPGLALARAQSSEARRASVELLEVFEKRSRELEPPVEPDEPMPKPERGESLELALLGIELAAKQKEEIRLEQNVVHQEGAGRRNPATEVACERLRELRQRYTSAGDDLWRHQKKKMRLDDPGTVRLLDPRGNAVSECLLAIYRKCDGIHVARKRPSQWRSNAEIYYEGCGTYHKKDKEAQGSTWCHISGQWHPVESVKAAHVVPFFLDTEGIGEMLFGDRSESLSQAGNSLLLSNIIKGWFDSYHLVVVPVDANETPITRWKTDAISSDIRNSAWASRQHGHELDGKELVFLNEKRPVSRFLYFHFVMALVRIKDIKRHGWEDVWARYYTQRPFLTPGNYMRRSMLLALATHFGADDMDVVSSWIVDHGFDSPPNLAEDEATEAARRVHEAAEAAIARAERPHSSDDDAETDSERLGGRLGL